MRHIQRARKTNVCGNAKPVCIATDLQFMTTVRVTSRKAGAQMGHHSMFSLAVALIFGALFTVADTASAQPLQNAALKQKVTGRTVLLNTGYGISLPIRYRSNGTMTAKSTGVAKYIGYSQDNGRWWIKGDRLCQKWSKWLKGATRCFKLKISGRNITWSSRSGTSGTARIVN